MCSLQCDNSHLHPLDLPHHVPVLPCQGRGGEGRLTGAALQVVDSNIPLEKVPIMIHHKVAII